MRTEHYSTGLRPAECTLKRRKPILARRNIPVLARRVWQWFTRQMRMRRDAAILNAMNEYELKDIGLYRRGAPSKDSIVPESRRLEENFIMLDGFPLSSGGRKTPI